MLSKQNFRMKLKYVTYKQAQDLKKLGYDLPCERYYPVKHSGMIVTHGSLLDHNSGDHNIDVVSAPDLTDVQTWFREKHRVEVNASWVYLKDGWSGYYNKMDYPGLEENTEDYYGSYEEALSEAISIGIENLL